jgi:alpha-tubulin suppressor-like RCC1 family protein
MRHEHPSITASIECRDPRRAPRRLAHRLAALVALASAACADRSSSPAEPLAALAAGGPPIEVVRDPDIFCPFGCDAIAAGDSMQHMVRFVDPSGREHHLEQAQWSSADPRIATVSKSGMVVGRKPGETEIRATIGTRSATLAVAVAAAHIERVVLTAPTTELEVRESVQLKAVAIDVLGDEVPDAPLFWFPATPSVVTVDANGVATAVGPGDGMVMVFAEFGRSAWISLHVNGSDAAPALPVGSVSVGSTHTCASGPAGPHCWGWNYFGQLGNGSFGDPSETFPMPLPVAGGHEFASTAAGGFHSCALTGEGAAYCWGYGFYGELGDGTFGGGSPLPVAVVGAHRFASISAGDHTCAVDVDGKAHCWGPNFFGTLGNGSFDHAAAPTPVALDAPVTAIFAGLWHSCALAADGSAWCWGDNDFGQLGNGRIGGTDSPSPVKVSTRHAFVAMDSRYSHSCGLTATGELHCWGRNDEGQLGDGSRQSRARPVAVPSSVPFAAVATGTHHSCALGVDRRAYCWGNNEYGQLGDNTLTRRLVPAPVHGDLRFRTLSAANNVTCATTDAGDAWCWGSSHFGMLGNGQNGWDTVSPVPVRVRAGKR